MNKIKYFLKENELMLKLVLGFIVMVLIVVFSVYTMTKKVCLSTYSDYHPQFGFWSDCRIIWNGKLTPTDMIKNITIIK